jgi:CRISPR-associated protein Cas1
MFSGWYEMRKLLNTLYVTNSNSYLARDGETILIRVDDEVKFKIPAINLESIVCFGYQGASPALMRLCVEKGISISFMNEYGKFLARVTGPVKGNVLLRRTQFRLSDDEEVCLGIAKNMIAGKIANCRYVLNRAIRDHGDKVELEAIRTAAEYLNNCYKRLNNCKSLDQVRGVEGDAAGAYFRVLDHLILQQKEDFYIKSRNRRPPMDRFNALISFLYSMLGLDVTSALEAVGLDPAVGFLHRDRSGRNSLSLDLMEELRPYLADRLALSLINRRQITADDFTVKETGAVLLNENARKNVMTAWQKRKQEEIEHPFIKEKIVIGLVPYVQALLLARFFRKDIEGYPPFLCR